MKHKHHIKPKHRGGTDDDGIVEVSVIQHAMFHWCEWQLHGHWQDKVAWQALSGKTTSSEEARRLAASEAQKNRVWTEESRQKARQAKLGRTFKHKAETRRKIGLSNAKPIRCLELDTTFSGVWEASRQLGISRRSISGMLHGDRKKVRYKGKWIRFEYLNN